MRLGTKQAFLVLAGEPRLGSSTIALKPNLGAVLRGWTAGTRISPVWGFHEFGCDKPKTIRFDGRNILIFLGPVSPAALWKGVDLGGRPANANIWLGVGSYNTIIRLDCDEAGPAVGERILEWADSRDVPYERWVVQSGTIEQVSAHAARNEGNPKILTDLARLSQTTFDPSLRLEVQEFLTLMASSITRSANTSSTINDRLRKVLGSMASTLAGSLSGDSKRVLDTHAALVIMNAALSRFSSQAFSGISPIASTECHFWIHSLLGTGAANIALMQLTSFIQSTLGEARLPERVLALKGVTSQIPTHDELLAGDEFLWKDHIGGLRLDKATDGEVRPLITYFSGRDGYSSQLQTLSAPLSCIAQATAHRTNILTVTHEISHIFVEGILGYLYPDPDDDEAFLEFAKLSESEESHSNLFDVGRRLLIEAMLTMESDEENRQIPQDEISADFMKHVAVKWRREIKEILVHTFDYMYFYNDDPEFYINSIWATWCAIPGIGDRIEEYILRTVCAVSPRLLRHEPKSRRQEILAIFRKALQPLADDATITSNYATTAMRHLASNWSVEGGQGTLSSAYDARIYLVRLVAALFHSETIAAKLFKDPRVVGGSPTGYTKTKGVFDDEAIENPLRFARVHLEKSPKESDSLWLLHNMAFCTTQEGRG